MTAKKLSRITKKVVDENPPLDREFTVWDSELKGFGLRVRPSGARSYVVVYRRAGQGRRAPVRRVTIDAVGKITPDEARRAAKRILGSVAHGADPAEERSLNRRAETLADLAGAFLAQHVSAKRKASTEAKYRYVIETLIVPAFGRLRPADVTRAAVARMHHENAERPTIANYAVAVLSAIYTFGEARGLILEGSNPTRYVERFEEEKRERFLTTAELARLGEALNEAETQGLPWRGVAADGPKAKHLVKPQNSTFALRFRCGRRRAAADFHGLPIAGNSAS